MLILENIRQEDLNDYIKEFYKYASGRLKKMDRKPKITLKKDKKNAENFFGKTGYYSPDEEEITLFVTNRHPKDVLRSFAHELIHHYQKCAGLDKDVDMAVTSKDPAYALHDKGLRNLEKQAFRMGNMLFRDWCDTKKMEKEKTMSESKRKDALDILLERVENTLKEAAKKEKKKKEDNKKKTLKAKKKGKKDAKTVYKSATGEAQKEENEKEQDLKESLNIPHPRLFETKQRLFNERFSKHEQLVYEQLLKLATK